MLDAASDWTEPPSQGGLVRATESVGTDTGIDERRTRRSEKYRLQRQAQKLLPDTRTACCLLHRQDGGKAVGIVKRDGRASFSNLQSCGAVWACPICSARIAEVRRDELRQLLEWSEELEADAEGQVVWPVLLTLTARHRWGDDLGELLDGLKLAKRKLRQSRDWQGLKGQLVGTVTATELTFGQAGWHPHFHELLLVRAATEVDAIAAVELLRPRWLRSLELVGLDGYGPAALHVGGAKRAGAYLAKFGLDAESQGEGGTGWGIGDELTRGASKAGAGRHPFRLLADAAAGDKAAGGRFREYVAALKGRRQLVWSPGLKARIGLDDVDDEVAAAPEDDEGQVVEVAIIGNDDWRAVRLVHGSRRRLLDAAEIGGASAVTGELAVIRARAAVIRARKAARFGGSTSG